MYVHWFVCTRTGSVGGLYIYVRAVWAVCMYVQNKLADVSAWPLLTTTNSLVKRPQFAQYCPKCIFSMCIFASMHLLNFASLFEIKFFYSFLQMQMLFVYTGFF